METVFKRKVFSWIAYILGIMSVCVNYFRHNEQSTGIVLVIIFAVIYLTCINVAITAVSTDDKKPNAFLDMLWIIIPSIFFEWVLISVVRVTDDTILIVPIIQLLVVIFSFIAKKIFLNSKEYEESKEEAIKNEEKRKVAEEEKRKRNIERQNEIEERNAKKEEERQRKIQEKENKIYNEWLDYHERLISRGMKYYRVSSEIRKDYYGGRTRPTVYVEALNKESAIVEARKQPIIKGSIYECVLIAGGKNMNYDEIAEKWKQKDNLGNWDFSKV